MTAALGIRRAAIDLRVDLGRYVPTYVYALSPPLGMGYMVDELGGDEYVYWPDAGERPPLMRLFMVNGNYESHETAVCGRKGVFWRVAPQRKVWLPVDDNGDPKHVEICKVWLKCRQERYEGRWR